MTRAHTAALAVLLPAVLLLAAACGTEPAAEPEPEPAAANPIERGVAPARTQAATADSLMRERERQVREAMDGSP